MEKILYRELDINKTDEKEDENGYTYTLSFASRIPYLRSFGYEIIDVKNMKLDRLNNNGALLYNHNRDEVIGVVEKAWVKDDIAYAEVRLSKTNEQSVKIKKMIDEKILNKVSFGYTCLEAQFLKEEKGVDYYEFKVLPYEISIVSIPADDTVGLDFKRELTNLKQNFILSKEKQNMTDQVKNQENTKEATVNDDVSQIIELGDYAGQRDLAFTYVREGRSLADFKNALSKLNASSVAKNANSENIDNVNSNARLGDYIIKSLLENGRFGLDNNARDFMGTTVAGKGKELVQQKYTEIINNIKGENLIEKLGFDVRNNVSGVLNVPALSEAPEGVVQTSEDMVIDGKVFKTVNTQLNPETFVINTKHSYNVIKEQNGEYIDKYIIEAGLRALYTQLSTRLIEKLYEGTALTVTPAGSPVNYKDVVSLQNDVYLDNSEGKYLVTKKLANTLKTISKFDNAGLPILNNGDIDGEKVVVHQLKSANLQSKEFILYGDFGKFVVALYGEPDVLISQDYNEQLQLSVKFVVRYGAALVNPVSVSKADVTL
jgi:caudovirus prohead protease|nr:MAG TPA: major capsid protein [Caudoviricetes sp.]